MKFVMTQAVCPEGMKMLENKAEVWVADNPDPNQYLSEMQNADALIVRLASCNGQVIDQSPQLKVIGRTGVGYDSVDIEAATRHGIPVVITPGANNRAVAEHAVAMMFALSKNLHEAQSEMEKGNWEIRGAQKAFELLGKKIGIIGLGAIGQEVLNLCQGIGMESAAYDPYLQRTMIEELGTQYYADYREMLKECDVISVHVPFVTETKGMIGVEELKLMKKTALLINCSRGGIINEAALIEALNKGIIAGAGLDVFDEEPLKPGNPILSARNMIISPHSAAQTREAVVNMATMCVQGCLAVLAGEKWPHVANPQAYQHEKWRQRGWH